MQIKVVHPINFLFFRTDTKVSELVKFIPIAQELFREAVGHNLSVTGPIHWHYRGFEGDATKPFTLEIASPIDEIPKAYDGRFHFKRTQLFKCVSSIHEGNWLDMPRSYRVIMEFIEQNNLKPVAVNREIYINTDFRNPAANVTDIQMGIN